MFRILVGMQEAYRHRLDPLPPQVFRYVLELFRPGRGFDAAVRPDALVHLLAKVSGNQRGRAAEPDVEHAALDQPPAPADFDDVPEPARGHQRRHGAAPLQERIGGDGGSMDHALQLLAFEPEVLQARQDGSCGFIRNRWDLPRPHLAAFGIDRYEVGERSTDVDA